MIDDVRGIFNDCFWYNIKNNKTSRYDKQNSFDQKDLQEHFLTQEVSITTSQYGFPRFGKYSELPAKIFYPEQPGDYKIIVFSHGLFGNPNNITELAKAWTQQGFIVIAPAHADSFSTIYEPFNVENSNQVNFQFRANDVKIALNYLSDQNNNNLLPGYTIDQTAPVVAGHSYGATIASWAAGATLYFNGLPDQSGNEERFAAAITLSGTGVNENFIREDSFNTIDIPFLRFSGTYDLVPLEVSNGLNGAVRIEPALLAQTAGNDASFAIYLEGAQHSSFVTESRFFTTTSESQAAYQATKNITANFLNGYINGNDDAKALVKAASVNNEQVGSNGNDVLWGDENYNILLGRKGNDFIVGTDYAEDLYGMDGNDIVLGREGADFLSGGEGNDLLVGGEGGDIYLIDQNTGSDRIYTFNPNEDRLLLVDGIEIEEQRVNFFANRTELFLNDGGKIYLDNVRLTPEQVEAVTLKTTDVDGYNFVDLQTQGTSFSADEIASIELEIIGNQIVSTADSINSETKISDQSPEDTKFDFNFFNNYSDNDIY